MRRPLMRSSPAIASTTTMWMFLAIASTLMDGSQAFSAPISSLLVPSSTARSLPRQQQAPLRMTAVEDDAAAPTDATDKDDDDSKGNNNPAASYQAIFDFTKPEQTCVDSFERIDDAVMGGISTSALRDVPGKSYASWSGMCRLDGGGFCGTRTLPFEKPLLVNDADGMYIDCSLASDAEPERRVWKLTSRTDTSRGEQVYQASFQLPPQQSKEEWVRVTVPFSDFREVRGPRLLPGSAPLNVTSGLYQIGLSLSKFVMNESTKELENFRPGYFELRLQAIGVYTNTNLGSSAAQTAVEAPTTTSLSKGDDTRPLWLKLLRPLAKLFFSEQSNRRKSAMKLLRTKRGLSRAGAIAFGVRNRAQGCGMLRSLAKTASILLVDSFRAAAGCAIRYGLFLPVLFLIRTFKRVGTMFGTPTKGGPTPSVE